MTRAILFAFYLSCAIGASFIFYRSLPGADIRYIGSRVDRGIPVEQTVISQLGNDRSELLASCDGETLRVMRSVVLLNLNQQDQFTDFDAWTAAFETARVAFRHSLRCAPADGITWAAYAMVEASIATEPTLLNQLLELSLWTAPVERSALYARYKVRRLVGEGAAKSVTAGMDDDARTAAAYLRPTEVAELGASLPPTYRQSLIDAATLLSPDRQQALRAAGLQVPTTAVKSAR